MDCLHSKTGRTNAYVRKLDGAQGVGMGKLFSLFLVQNAMVKRLTESTIDVGIAVPQRSYLILDALNSPSGIPTRVMEIVYLVDDLVRGV